MVGMERRILGVFYFLFFVIEGFWKVSIFNWGDRSFYRFLVVELELNVFKV